MCFVSEHGFNAQRDFFFFQRQNGKLCVHFLTSDFVLFLYIYRFKNKLLRVSYVDIMHKIMGTRLMTKQ